MVRADATPAATSSASLTSPAPIHRSMSVVVPDRTVRIVPTRARGRGSRPSASTASSSPGRNRFLRDGGTGAACRPTPMPAPMRTSATVVASVVSRRLEEASAGSRWSSRQLARRVPRVSTPIARRRPGGRSFRRRPARDRGPEVAAAWIRSEAWRAGTITTRRARPTCSRPRPAAGRGSSAGAGRCARAAPRRSWRRLPDRSKPSPVPGPRATSTPRAPCLC